MPMVDGKQRRYLGSSDRAGRRQFVDGKIVAEARLQLQRTGQWRRWWSGWSEDVEKPVSSERSACWRDAAVAARVVQRVVVVVVVVVGGKWSIEHSGPGWSVGSARHQVLSTAAVGSAATSQHRRHQVAAGVLRWHAVFTCGQQRLQRRQKVELGLRSFTGWTAAPATHHFRLIATPTDVSWRVLNDVTELNWTDAGQFLTNWPMGKQGEPVGHWLLARKRNHVGHRRR